MENIIFTMAETNGIVLQTDPPLVISLQRVIMSSIDNDRDFDSYKNRVKRMGRKALTNLRRHRPDGRPRVFHGISSRGKKNVEIDTEIIDLIEDIMHYMLDAFLGSNSRITTRSFLRILALHMIQNPPTEDWICEHLRLLEKELYVKQYPKKHLPKIPLEERHWEELFPETIQAGMDDPREFKKKLLENIEKKYEEMWEIIKTRGMNWEDLGAPPYEWFQNGRLKVPPESREAMHSIWGLTQ